MIYNFVWKYIKKIGGKYKYHFQITNKEISKILLNYYYII